MSGQKLMRLPKNLERKNAQNSPIYSADYDYAAEQAALLSLETEEAEWPLTDWEEENATLDAGSDEETLEEVAEQTTYGAVFLNELIKRQRALSLSVAFVFLIFIFSFPLISFLGPQLTSFQILGLPVNWLLLGLLIYPLVWFLAFFFVSTADKYEEEFTRLVSGPNRKE